DATAHPPIRQAKSGCTPARPESGTLLHDGQPLEEVQRLIELVIIGCNGGPGLLLVGCAARGGRLAVRARTPVAEMARQIGLLDRTDAIVFGSRQAHVLQLDIRRDALGLDRA